MSAALELPDPMSLAEFLVLDHPGETRWQLVDGVPQAMAPASPIHGGIQNQLGHLFAAHLATQGSPCRSYIAPGIALGAKSDRNYRIPDVAVTCSLLVPGEPTLPNPVVLVEVLSPSNAMETWINVWAYTTIPSAREILVVRTDAVGAQLLRRDADGHWPSVPAIVEGELSLESIRFRVALEKLYEGTWLV